MWTIPLPVALMLPKVIPLKRTVVEPGAGRMYQTDDPLLLITVLSVQAIGDDGVPVPVQVVRTLNGHIRKRIVAAIWCRLIPPRPSAGTRRNIYDYRAAPCDGGCDCVMYICLPAGRGIVSRLSKQRGRE